MGHAYIAIVSIIMGNEKLLKVREGRAAWETRRRGSW